MRVYNAAGRRPTLLVASYLDAPVSGEIWIKLHEQERAGGRYGLVLTGTVPRIAGRAAIVHLGLGFRKGIFSAACPVDRQLQTKLHAVFGGGSESTAVAVTRCG